jgi:hypothetical protein
VSLTEVRAVVESEPVIVRRNTRRINTLSEGKRHIDSDSDDDIPITATLTKPLKGGPNTGIPTGIDAIGLIVARDFGANGGIFHGRISAVDMEGRRVHYHVTYDDGDEEDFDYEEMKYAIELQEAIALGTYQAVEATPESRITSEDDEVSVDGSYDGVSLDAISTKGAKTKRHRPLKGKKN